ncbi:MAG: anti-sigma factor [Acidobacteriia bacterium]|nr:anti-sigma factor [Terriglobia bacterium]
MDCKESKEAMGLYVVGALALDEVRELEEHIEHCPTCKVERAADEQAYALLPFALDGPSPPASARRALLDRLEEERSTRRVEARGLNFLLRPAFAYVLLALTVLAIALVGFQEHQRYSRQIAAARAEIDTLRSQIDLTQAQLALIQAPDTTVLNLAGQPVHPEAVGKLFWNKSRKIWLVYIFQLPAPPSGKAYELWFLTRKNPVQAGMISSDSQGNGFAQISIPEGVEPISAAVSLEPEQGVSAPTGAIYLAGT